MVGIGKHNIRKGILDFMTLFVNAQSGERKKAGKGQRQLLASEAISLHPTAKLDMSGTQNSH